MYLRQSAFPIAPIAIEEEPFYSSNSDIGAPPQQPVVFSAPEEIQMTINKPPVVQAPYYNDITPVYKQPDYIATEDTTDINSTITPVPSKLIEIINQPEPVFKAEVIPFVPDFSSEPILVQQPAPPVVEVKTTTPPEVLPVLSEEKRAAIVAMMQANPIVLDESTTNLLASLSPESITKISELVQSETVPVVKPTIGEPVYTVSKPDVQSAMDIVKAIPEDRPLTSSERIAVDVVMRQNPNITVTQNGEVIQPLIPSVTVNEPINQNITNLPTTVNPNSVVRKKKGIFDGLTNFIYKIIYK